MAVNSLSVPERYREGLARLAKLSPELAERLEHVVHQSPPALYPEALVNEIIGTIPDVDREVLDPLMQALLSLFPASEDLHLTTEQLASQISASPDLDLSAEERQELAKRITRLMEARSLMVTAKALSLLTEVERPFHEARIVSDIRPIFPPDPEKGPAAALIVHTLVISFRSGQPDGQIHVAMDSDDIESLRSVLDRALKKAKALQELLRSAHIPLLNPLQSQ